MEAKLYAGNLSFATTEDELRTRFAQSGTVAPVPVIKDRDTDRSRCFAFVEMSSQVEAQKAIGTLLGNSLDTRELTVHLARPREERGGFGNRRGGKRRY